MPIPLSSKEAAKLGLGKKRSKYGAIRTEVDGITFSSKKEARVYQDFALQKRAGIIDSLELQVRYPLCVNGKLICTYVADFVVKPVRGALQIWDAKGFRTRDYRLKKKLFEALMGIEIQEI